MILIRHGQSEFNAAREATGRDPGIEDPSLTELGRRQAREAADLLRQRGEKVGRLLTSPYSRAIETALIIAEALGLPVEIEPLVREQAAYRCDIGSPRSRLGERWPALCFAAIEEVWWPDLDETGAAVAARCRAFRRRAADWRDWRQVAVVSHWGFIRHLTGHSARNAELVEFDPTRLPSPRER